MGIQPIDLQVMYSQSVNVSKIASSAQSAQLSDSIMQQTTVVQQNLENARKVHSTTDDKASNQKVDNNKRGGGSGSNFNKKRNGDSSESSEKSAQNLSDSENVSSTPRSSYLGTIIDILG